MTSLAYLHDCHSCYDERSIDQKKTNDRGAADGCREAVWLVAPSKGVILSTAWSACFRASPNALRARPWHQHGHGAAGSSGAMEMLTALKCFFFDCAALVITTVAVMNIC